MANSPDTVVATLKSMPDYGTWFTASFPDEADPGSYDNMAKAIEPFETTLLTPSPLRNIVLTAPCFHSGKVWDQ